MCPLDGPFFLRVSDLGAPVELRFRCHQSKSPGESDVQSFTKCESRSLARPTTVKFGIHENIVINIVRIVPLCQMYIVSMAELPYGLTDSRTI